jgi:catechol-2,3-dioxygenase
MNIPENKIEEAQDWLLQHNCKLLKATPNEVIDVEKNIVYFHTIHAHSVYFYDPAGNLVELIARHHLNNSSIKQFDVSSSI